MSPEALVQPSDVWHLVAVAALFLVVLAWLLWSHRRLAARLAELRRAELSLRESEQHFRALAETAPLAIVILQEGRLTYANAAAERLTGYTRQDLPGLDPTGLFHPDDVPGLPLWPPPDGTGETGLPTHHEARLVTRQGEVRWCDLGVIRTTLSDRPVVVAAITDVTERRRAAELQAALFEIDEAAHAAEDLDSLYPRLHRILMRLAPAANLYIALQDEATGLISFPYFVDEVDDPPANSLPVGRGLTAYVLRTGQPLLATPEVFDRLLAAGEVDSVGAPSVDWLGVPLRVRDRTIGVLAIQTYSHEVRYGEAERDLLVYVSNQVAQAIERKRTEQAVRESQRQLTTLMSNLPGMAYRCRNDQSWTMELVSEGCQELTGYTPAELLGNAVVSYDEVVHPEDRKRLHREVEEALSLGRPYEFTYRIVTAAGGVKWVWERGRGVYGPDGELLALEGFISDVTAERAMNEALRRSEERYRLALQATQEIMYDWDIVTGRIVWSPAVVRVLGWSLEEFGDSIEAWERLIHPDDAPRVGTELGAAVATGEVFSSEYRIRRKSGEWAVVLDRGLIVRDSEGHAARMVGTMTDLTARQSLERQLQQAQKLEAVGQLAGGIAHDFNNLLTAILGSTELAQRALPPSHPAQDELSTIQRTAERAAELTRGLLAYARKQVLESVDLDLNEVVRGALPMLRRMIPEHIDIDFAADTAIGPVRGDRGQLTQILVNLCVNARDAMPEGGSISIRTEDVWIDPGAVPPVAGLGPGRYVLLTVSDTGTGIPSHDLPHVFEPFFTTKAVGEGTGLGLAVAYGVVRQHNGTVEVDSAPGKGTTFRIYLPATPAAARHPAEPRGLPAEGGRETILVVEDEPEVRSTLLQILGGLGYLVLSAANGQEALQVLEHGDTRVDLVLTDVVMPRMGGRELFEAVQARPDAPLFLFSSGYAEAFVTAQLPPDRRVAFIAKPYGIEELARKVRDVLARRG
ncbi:MAG TPA: PAS domain-containing protein [Thermoanaerobaculaceae bacterium]|nr:PAS domain-containing protein [Thermoanaerobaculaceae bacterium]HRS14884.1 PAS domain-containing protein [Thermoanaerobaculaceae bacterium]